MEKGIIKSVKDPSLKEVMGDIWKAGLSKSETIEGIRVAAAMKQGKLVQTIPRQSNNVLQQKDVFLYSWNEWEQPLFYERLKKSYDMIKKTYGKTKQEN
jgi:hypothetical protein